MILNKPDGTTIDIIVDDKSYVYKAIRGNHQLTLYFSLAEYISIPIGSTCDFGGETYTLEKPESLTMHHTRNYEYTVTMEGEQSKAAKFKFRNPTDGRLKFPLTATPREHLQMFVDNMNMRDSGWAIGNVVDGVAKYLSYDHYYCLDALNRMADEFDVEWEISGKTVSLWKVEYNKDNPLALSYGRGNGFLPDIGRTNFNDSRPIEILFAQGAERNIDPYTYGTTANPQHTLLLPKGQTIAFDGTHFEDEEGYNSELAHSYISSADGLSVQRADRELQNYAEDSLDCSEIYPSRIGNVSGVEVVGVNNNLYDIIDAGNTVDYSQYSIKGEVATIIFQSGMLVGKEFEIQTNKNGDLIGYTHADKRFKLVQQEIDGVIMPGGAYVPSATTVNPDGTIGDKYAVFHIRMPQAYMEDDTNKSGASWDMMRQAVRYLYDNEVPRFSFTGTVNGIWARENWATVGDRLILGGYIAFSDNNIVPNGSVLIRIMGMRVYVNSPYKPEIELSNTPIRGTMATRIKNLESQEVTIDESYRNSVQFTKRRYQDAKEYIDMLANANLDEFGEPINPLAVTSMMGLFGSEQLQLQFIADTTNPERVDDGIMWDNEAQILRVPASIIQHLTMGVTNISSSHTPSEYKYWSLEAFTSPTIVDPTTKWYLYANVAAVANGSTGTGYFALSQTMPALNAGDGSYNLLIGLLGSELDGLRSFTRMYGYTAIYPGQVVADAMYSSDGTEMVDFIKNIFKISNALYTAGIDYGVTRKDALTIKGVNAGMSGVGSGANGTDADTDVRFYAGSDFNNRNNAPFRVLHDGTVVSSKSVIQEGSIVAGAIIRSWRAIKNGAPMENNKFDNMKLLSGTFGNDLELLWTPDQDGRIINIVSDDSGFIEISTPDGTTNTNFFIENGIKVSRITFSRQTLTLAGYKGANNNFIWQVLSRVYWATVSGYYGKARPTLCAGIVTVASDLSVSIQYACFDDYFDNSVGSVVHRSQLSVVRNGAGKYTVNLPKWGLSDDFLIVNLNGIGVTIDDPDDSSPIKATFNGWGLNNLSFDILTSDDNTLNDGSFSFELMNMTYWIM